VSMALVTLIRPGDAAYLAVPLLAASLLPGPERTGPGRDGWWRRWPAAAATGLGLLAGGAEWVAEAYLRFGGVASRLRAAGAEQGGFGLHFALLDELKALNGPTLCRPCTVGVRYPELDLWWFLLPVLVALAVLAARQAGRGTPAPGAPGPVTLETVLLPVACACCVAAQYLFMINYAAPRFLLPAYALLAVPAADGLAFLRNVPGAALRPAMTAVLGGLLAVSGRRAWSGGCRTSRSRSTPGARRPPAGPDRARRWPCWPGRAGGRRAGSPAGPSTASRVPGSSRSTSTYGGRERFSCGTGQEWSRTARMDVK
jgi:hypothetical protein